MAGLFAARGNPKRALELVDLALRERAAEVRFVAAKANYLHALGRSDDARRIVQRAFASGLDGKELRKIGRTLRKLRRR